MTTFFSFSSFLTREMLVFLYICLFRICNTFLVQTYFDPDEFWQTLEPAYCHVFGDDGTTRILLLDDDEDDDPYPFHCPGLTWEWKRRFAAPSRDSWSNFSSSFSKEPWSPLVQFVQPSLWGPTRTYLSIVPTWLYYQALKRFFWFFKHRLDPSTNSGNSNNNTVLLSLPRLSWWKWWLVARGPMWLYAVTVAAPTDYAVWYCAKWLPPTTTTDAAGSKSNTQVSLSASEANILQSPNWSSSWCLFCSLVSWFGAFTMVRTYSNAQETALVTISLAVVSPELLGNSFIRRKKDPTNDGLCSFWIRAPCAFFLGGLAVAIRFTALAAYIPMGILLALDFGVEEPLSTTNSTKAVFVQRLQFLLYPCATFGALGVGVSLVVDRFFYGFWAMPFLASYHFNVLLNQATLYGTHDWHWNFTVALPVLTGLILPFALMDLTKRLVFLTKRLVGARVVVGPRGSDRDCNGEKAYRNLWILVICYLTILSLNAHKEFRFLLPVLPMICLIAGRHVAASFGHSSRGRARMVLGGIFVLPNLIALLYLGLFHQRGPIAVNEWIVQDALRQATSTTGVEGRLARSTKAIHVHYLTGGCHSTPLHSHLHGHPALQFITYTLDCSPTCRSDPNLQCETDRFQKNPFEFLQQKHYDIRTPVSVEANECSTGSSNDEPAGTISLSSDSSEPICRQSPHSAQVSTGGERTKLEVDYVITMSCYVDTLKSSLGLREAVRFVHNINGARVFGMEFGEGFALSHFQRLNVLHLSWIEVSLDEMVILVKE
ncbi:hypothetical protein ACA910_017964 [Epithemia clementina (nom. ined.)]